MNVSFILPCYNVERYIADCLNSIFSQGLADDDYEVICVNDCSTDNTRAIICSYLQDHNNLYLIDHSVNRTSGGARNTGIEASHGEYIWFVDPDDMIKESSCASLLKIAFSDPSDVIFFNFEAVDERGEHLFDNETFGDTSILSGLEYVERFFPSNLSELCIVWRCLFSRSLLVDSGIRFPVMRKAEDTVFLWNILLCASSVRSIKDVFYQYRDNRYSVGKKNHVASVIFSERILLGYEVVKILNRPIVSVIIKKDFINIVNWCANDNLSIISELPQHEKDEYYRLMKSHYIELRTLWPYMRTKSRVLLGPSLGRLAWRIKVAFLNKVLN